MGSSNISNSLAPHTATRLLTDSVGPYYYLENFETVVSWVLSRHRDLLLAAEIDILEAFPTLPLTARALLVRMIMRKGNVFRASKLCYDETGPVETAVRALLVRGWVEQDTLVDLTQLFALLTKTELVAAFAEHLPASGRKLDWLANLQPLYPAPKRFSAWYTASDDKMYTLLLMPLCDRLRLMYFGNLHQDWSEFILRDLGILKYERVEFSEASRAFHTRSEIDIYLQLHYCRERLEADEPVSPIVDELLRIETANTWIARRRAKLLFRIGQHHERNNDLELALAIYSQALYPRARARCIRVLERLHRFDQALSVCEEAIRHPHNDEEIQLLQRMLPRLQRHMGMRMARRQIGLSHTRIELVFPQPTSPYTVERLVQDQLQQDNAPVHFVENSLINSLFGLLCWEAIFAPLPGAFFHPFQEGPADLLSAEFYSARATFIDALLAQLETGEYLGTIRANYQVKHGLQSPFVYWSLLDDILLEQALACLPPTHLRKLFERLLADLNSNRSGLPDLIQLWPYERRYRMIEVKGPGDRLQDNQVRWLDFCAQRGIPVSVCYVQWQKALP